MQEPGRSDFRQAMRLLERGAVPGVAGRPVGGDAMPKDEVVRLRGSTQLGFPADAVEAIARRRTAVAGDVRAVDLTVAFHGMFVAQGVLPWHYTEYVVERLSKRDRSLRDFADALQHRSLAFHYRAWRKYRLPFACESAAVEGGVDDVTTALRGLVGVGTDHLRERVVEGCERWIHFAGLFGRAQRTTRGLEAMLEALLGVPAEVQEFVGHWQDLVPAECSRLGRGRDDDHRSRLGSTMILGTRVFDVLAGIRVRIGPVAATALPRLAALGGEAWLPALVRSYLGPDIDFDLRWRVDRATVSPLRLDGTAALGFGAWVSAKSPQHYDAEVPVCSRR